MASPSSIMGRTAPPLTSTPPQAGVRRRMRRLALFCAVALAAVAPAAHAAVGGDEIQPPLDGIPLPHFVHRPRAPWRPAREGFALRDGSSSSSSSSSSGSGDGSDDDDNDDIAFADAKTIADISATAKHAASKAPAPTPRASRVSEDRSMPDTADDDDRATPTRAPAPAAKTESDVVSFGATTTPTPSRPTTPTPTTKATVTTVTAFSTDTSDAAATVATVSSGATDDATDTATEAVPAATDAGSIRGSIAVPTLSPSVETPYRSTFCRCQAGECQNEFPGELVANICEPPRGDGSCPAGFSKCVASSSYKMQVTPTAPNTVADVTFALLASDVAGALYNLGDQNPLRGGDKKWWVAFRLPAGWRFVAWGSTTATVEIASANPPVSQQVRVYPCEQVTAASNCRGSHDADNVGFVRVQDLVADWQAFVTATEQAPLTIRMARSVVSGPSSTSASGQVDVYIVYETTAGPVAAQRHLGVRELYVSASAASSSSGVGIVGNLSAISLAKINAPTITPGSLHSSMIWVEAQKKQVTLSFTTTTVIGRDSNDPRVCVNLRPAGCGKRGRMPTANVTWEADPIVTFASGGNPFLFFYETADRFLMNVIQVNETFFCVSKLIPSGAIPNATWELRQPFRFQLSIQGVVWSSDKANGTTDYSEVPALAEITLTDRGEYQGIECSQLVVHEQPSANHGLSVYSVMSVTIYAVAFVGAVLITRMNGLTFSASTFYNDMTSVCVIIVFLFSIVGNTIWINVAGDGTSTNASHVYYLTRILTACFSWTMITSVCFHWSTVLNHDVRKIGRVYLMFTFAAINAVFYAFGIFMLISMSDFFKCAYDDYLKNPKYDKRMCDTDYCPDLQPYQWRYAAKQLCNAVSYSSLYFVATFTMDVLMFLASVALLVLGTYVLQRGSRLIAHTGNLVDDRIVTAMRNSLKTYLVVILAITLSLGVSTLTNVILYGGNWPMNAIAWYILTIWLPTLVPPAGFLVLQWNPRLHGMSWSNPSTSETRDRRDTKADDAKKALGRRNSTFGRLSDGWTGITDFPDTDYLPIGAETKEGPQQLMTLSAQFVTPVPITQACYMELYVSESDDEHVDEMNFNLTGRPQSVNTMIQSGLLRESMIVQNTRDNSTLLHSMLTTNTSWVRAGMTETVTPTAVQDTTNGQSAQVATFMSTVQIPNVSPAAMLRFVIYEVQGSRASSTSSTTSDRIGGSVPERPRRASSTASRARVFCEFTCAACEFVNVDEMRLVAPEGSHRGTQVATMMGDKSSSVHGPMLRVRCTTVSTRTLKESSTFYTTKCFQFAEGEDMIVEDMTESIFTNEIPRQFLDLLQKDRSKDLSRAEFDLHSFDEKCKRGLATGLYDNLIDQIQGENVQAVARSWLDERVRQRVAYIDALKECQQLCVSRADEGINIKASTEKKSLLLRFLPINLHIQDMWVGPTSDLRTQLLRRTSEYVKLYTGVTVGAFAAHGFKFRHGAGIISLRNRIVKKAPLRSASDRMLLSRIGSGLSEKSVEEAFDWTQAEVRAEDELKWHITMRTDMCVSQALTALVASFCRNLEAALQRPSDRQFLHVVDSIGFLWQVESLLSTQGKELGMLEDFYAAVEAMKGVTFVLDTAPAAHLPPTLNLHIKDIDLPSVVSVRLSGDSRAGIYTVVVGVRCTKETLDAIPTGIRGGAKIPVTAVMFTQGINEMQTLANGSSAKKTTLQQTINLDNFSLLKEYAEKYKSLASQVPGTFTTDLKLVENLLSELEEKIMAASKQMVKTKHPKIIQLSSRLCRLLFAGRVTSCKSAKDRTGMSVTLEQGHILCDYHGLPQEFLARTVSTMRSNGVRLENAFKNTGKRQYAFNALQRSLLPEEYKCPEGTYGRGNVS